MEWIKEGIRNLRITILLSAIEVNEVHPEVPLYPSKR